MAFKTSLFGAFALIFCTLANAQPSGRIVGGTDALVGQFPFQVAIFLDGEYNCGGSIITSRYILTAAHCTLNNGKLIPADELLVRVGSIQRMAGGNLVGVKRVIAHEEYGNWLNDVGLLELKFDLKFNDNIQKIDMFNGEVPKDAPVVISGWGRVNYGGVNPHRLQYNILTKMEPEDCQRVIGYGNDKVICLAHEINKGACNGDSGGPAVYNGKLVGISNFSQDGCGSWKPDVFAKVSYFRKWILSKMS